MCVRMVFVLTCIALIATTSFSAGAVTQKKSGAKQNNRIQSVTIILNDKGYQPASFKLRRGVPARITFVRQVEITCATEVVLPDYGIKRELPMGEPVVVEFTPSKKGEFSFACGMNMVSGKIIVR
jgi:plastocyanin domain-containing protein